MSRQKEHEKWYVYYKRHKKVYDARRKVYDQTTQYHAQGRGLPRAYICTHIRIYGYTDKCIYEFMNL